MMRLFLRFVIAVVMLPFFATGHEYWIETSGSHKIGEAATVRMYFGEFALNNRLSGKSLDKMKDIHVFVTSPDGKKHIIEMKQMQDYWEGIFLPQENGAYVITGINDEREVQDWTKHNLGITRPVQYLKNEYVCGKNGQYQNAGLLLDIVAAKVSKSKYRFSVIKKGCTLANQRIVVSPLGGEEAELKTNNKGTATVIIKKPGIYLVSVDWTDTNPGTFKGKQYETVRHRLDYTFTQE